MQIRKKERVFGVAVLVSIIVIFIPYILNGQLRLVDANTDIPAAPVWPEKQELVQRPKEMADFKSQPLKPHQPNRVAKDTVWVISAGVFPSKEEAERQVKILQGKNLPAYFKVDVYTHSTPQYWVLLGPNLQKHEAIHIMKQLEQDKIETKLKAYHPNMTFD